MPRFGQTMYGGPATSAGGAAQSLNGSYTGDGNATRLIPLPFIPDLVVVTGNGRQWIAGTQVGLRFAAGATPVSGDISIAASPMGFNLTSTQINASGGQSYNWFAMKGATS